jgi:tetratricopeptide (TPR) repeat protein
MDFAHETNLSLIRARRLADGVLIVLLVAVAFSLGCQELFDADVWWHVRAGQWIWANRTAPSVDPFTFASAERPWVDLHWLFQLMLAGAHGLAGVRGMIVFAAGICAGVILIALTARDLRWPMGLVAACWLPALGAMSSRFDPRPEVLSLLGVAVYLAVLFRTDRTPGLAWLLPVFEVVWVNSHALFLLGPIILGAYLIDRAATSRKGIVRAGTSGERSERRWWLHVGGAAAAVGAASLVNPYGLRGAIFPFELFPKITEWGGPYKAYVGEFMSLHAFVQQVGIESAAGDFFFLAECFLLWVLPLSFIVPAVWDACRQATVEPAAQPARFLIWACIFALALGLIVVGTMSISEAGPPSFLKRMGHVAPGGLVALGLFGAIVILLKRSSWAAALMAASGGAAMAAWFAWLRGHLFGPEPGQLMGVLTAALGGAACIFALRHGGRGRLFRMILAGGFGYLAVVAIRNINLFGLVAGFVLAWNLGEWAAVMSPSAEGSVALEKWKARGGLAFKAGLAVLLGLWIVGIVSGWFFRYAGEVRRFGLSEQPLAYAHEAARFAGRPGMPERAVALDLRQAAVYLFHNGPDRKLFIDGRLEIPSRATFETFVRLSSLMRQGRAGWAEPLKRMGDPLVLLDHMEDYGAEATLLADAAWRCVYYDSVASVFLRPRPGAPEAFPAIDFAARHFGDADWQAVPPVPLGMAEAAALMRLESALRRRPGVDSRWSLRASLMLQANDRLRQRMATGEGTDSGPASEAGLWILLGHSLWNLAPDLRVPPVGPEVAWDPARALLPAQATYCYRRALDLDPAGESALITLFDSFKLRRMADAQRSITALARRSRRDRGGAQLESHAGAGVLQPQPDAARERLPAWEGEAGLAAAVAELIEAGRPEAAVRLFAEGQSQGIEPSWPVCDGVAAALLHLGRPEQARVVWERAKAAPSPALKLTRVATARFAALDFEAALRGYRSALQLDARLGEAWFGVALLHTQRGQATAALAAAREGTGGNLTPAQRAFLTALDALVAPYAGVRQPE